MFGKSNFFKSKGVEEEISSLNLQSSERSSASSNAAAPSPSVPGQPALPSVDPAAVAEVSARTKQLMEDGPFPEVFYRPIYPNRGSVVFLTPNPARQSLLLFTSPIRALDYLRATGTQAVIVGTRSEALVRDAEAWRGAGIGSFIINKCPRCAVYNLVIPKDGLLTFDQLKMGWAINRATRDWKGGQLVRKFYSHSGPDRITGQRKTLEMIRDHVEYDNPYIHWVLALLAGMQEDEPARLAATANLEEFGAEFVGKTEPSKDAASMKPWTESMAKAFLGLSVSFGLIDLSKKPQMKPI